MHEKYGEKMKSNQDETEAYYNEFRTAKAVNEAMEGHIQKVRRCCRRCCAFLWNPRTRFVVRSHHGSEPELQMCHTHAATMYLALQVADDLNPLRCLALLRAIPRHDCELLDIAGRPEDLLMLAVPVSKPSYAPAEHAQTVDAGIAQNVDLKCAH